MCRAMEQTSEERRAVLTVGLLMNRHGVQVTPALVQLLNEHASLVVAAFRHEYGSVPVEPRVFVDRLGRPPVKVS